MYTYALANPKAEFTRPDLNNAIYKFSENGVLLVRAAGTFVVSDLPPKPDENWELVPQEVTWQEAIGAWLDGKTIKCVAHDLEDSVFEGKDGNKQAFKDQKGWTFNKIKLITGRWYIL